MTGNEETLAVIDALEACGITSIPGAISTEPEACSTRSASRSRPFEFLLSTKTGH